MGIGVRVATIGLTVFGSVCVAFGGTRTVAIDDVPTFNGPSVKRILGVDWNRTTPENVDMRNDGSAAQALTFGLRFGATTLSAGTLTTSTENGSVYFGDQSLPPTDRGLISLFAGKDLYGSSPTQYYSSIAIFPNSYSGYSLGEFGISSGSLLGPYVPGATENPPFPPFSATDIAPGGENRITRFTWFGMTDVLDTCSSSDITSIYNRNGPFGGTPCANHQTTPRYFGQITLEDVGTREDGDFNLFLAFGEPYVFNTLSATEGFFAQRATLFPTVRSQSFGVDLATVNAQTVGPTSTSGFILGNQKFEFGSYDSGTSPVEFRFRGGIACAVSYDAAGNETGCSRVTQLGDDPNLVPSPGIALLLAFGGLALVRVRILGSQKIKS
jgi:hypothetical protein